MYIMEVLGLQLKLILTMQVIKIIAVSIFFVFTINSCSQEANSSGVSENLNVSDFRDGINKRGVTLVDVRTPKEYANGYIHGAVLINYFDNDFDERINNLDKLKPVYVYCASGNRSSKAQNKFVELGFQYVYNLDGGFNSWKQNEYPIEK